MVHCLLTQPSDTHLPSSASIQLPQVHVEAELIQDDAAHNDPHAGTGKNSYLLCNLVFETFKKREIWYSIINSSEVYYSLSMSNENKMQESWTVAHLLLSKENKKYDFHYSDTDGMVLREGNYMSAVAEIGALEHSLTTDLLNHLVFVQKVFMKVCIY